MLTRSFSFGAASRLRKIRRCRIENGRDSNFDFAPVKISTRWMIPPLYRLLPSKRLLSFIFNLRAGTTPRLYHRATYDTITWSLIVGRKMQRCISSSWRYNAKMNGVCCSFINRFIIIAFFVENGNDESFLTVFIRD